MNVKSDPRGLLLAFLSYCMWGVFPLYWRLLNTRSALEILSHRMFWSFVFYLSIFLISAPREFSSLFRQNRRDWLLSAIAAVLLALNWGIYIYAVNSGQVLESSLAYFINPILNVAVGVLFFKETFPLILRLSVLFAALGVLSRVFYASHFPWISLVLAISFCTYGVTKKLLRIPARTSSVLEGTIGLLPATIGVFYFGSLDPVPMTPLIVFLFVFGGVVSGLPLFLFSYAAQRIPYSVMGMLQFVAPSLQFLVAIFVFHEFFTLRDFVSFGLIWLGILLYMANAVLQRDRLVS